MCCRRWAILHAEWFRFNNSADAKQEWKCHVIILIGWSTPYEYMRYDVEQKVIVHIYNGKCGWSCMQASKQITSRSQWTEILLNFKSIRFRFYCWEMEANEVRAQVLLLTLATLLLSIIMCIHYVLLWENWHSKYLIRSGSLCITSLYRHLPCRPFSCSTPSTIHFHIHEVACIQPSAAN